MLVSTLLLITLHSSPQSTKPPVDPATRQFDFWVGTWKLDGKTRQPGTDTWAETHSTNHITKILDGMVVHEDFKQPASKGQPAYRGESWSVYNPGAKIWRQTWVDNQGGYIPLRGEFKDGKMTLVTLANPAKPEVFSRMVYSHIEAKAFDWDWELSIDNGKTWQLQWHVHYTRLK